MTPPNDTTPDAMPSPIPTPLPIAAGDTRQARRNAFAQWYMEMKFRIEDVVNSLDAMRDELKRPDSPFYGLVDPDELDNAASSISQGSVEFFEITLQMCEPMPDLQEWLRRAEGRVAA
jgi:hypothetical protein